MYEADFNTVCLSLEGLSDEAAVAAIEANPTLDGWLTSIGVSAWQLWQKLKEWFGLTPRPNPLSAWFAQWWQETFGTGLVWTIPGGGA